MSHVFPTYARWNITPDHGKGSWLTSTDGTTYLDFTSGIGVTGLGHRHPKVEKAIIEQLQKYYHTSNLFQQPNQEALAEQLSKVTGLSAAFFANSGAEANEAAIKLAKKATGKSKIITCNGSFHGRTYATMGATGQEKVRIGYGPMLSTFAYVDFNNSEQLQAVADEETAAIMIEIIQGEGGINPITEAFIETINEVSSRTGALIIVDEIQTGIGRTGKPFAYQHFNIQPDIVTAAKGLGNGLPIGAMLGKEELVPYFGAGSHGSTFGGNPVSTAAALAVVEEVFEVSFLQEVAAKGEFLKNQLIEKLQDQAAVKDVRAVGLMVGIDLVDEVKAPAIIAELQKDELLVLPAGQNVIRLLPPLNVTEEEITIAVDKITAIIKHQVETAK
ncbi:MAG: acetylornithine transaminase [Bacillus sp. (in: firmicutes)]